MSPRHVEVTAYRDDQLVARYRRRIRGRFGIAADRMTRAVFRHFPDVTRVMVELVDEN